MSLSCTNDMHELLSERWPTAQDLSWQPTSAQRPELVSQSCTDTSRARQPSNVPREAPLLLGKEQLLYKSADEDIVELFKDSEVWIPGEIVKNISMQSTSSTSLARNLMAAIFQKDALYKCSVKGRKRRGLQSVDEDPRPALYPTGVSAILNYVQAFSENKFKVTPQKAWEYSQTAVLSAMGTKLSQIRRQEFD